MKIDYTNLESLIAVILACIATGIWRFVGVIFYNRISENGLLIKWINSVAYSMVAAVMMMILVYPSGILSTTNKLYEVETSSYNNLVVQIQKNNQQKTLTLFKKLLPEYKI